MCVTRRFLGFVQFSKNNVEEVMKRVPDFISDGGSDKQNLPCLILWKRVVMKTELCEFSGIRFLVLTPRLSSAEI